MLKEIHDKGYGEPTGQYSQYDPYKCNHFLPIILFKIQPHEHYEYLR